MIVRDVLTSHQWMYCFDWFNDFDDTIQWLKGFEVSSPDYRLAKYLVGAMTDRHRNWLTGRGYH